MKWHEIQEGINNCTDCRPAHPESLSPTYRQPARPPEPKRAEILLISEAPPPQGGFWEKSSDDALRRNLCSIILPQNNTATVMLDGFRARSLTLLQTLKWPFLETSTSEIRHSATYHLAEEISFIEPREIIALGRVAGRALQILYPKSDFASEFKRLKNIDALRIDPSEMNKRIMDQFLAAGYFEIIDGHAVWTSDGEKIRKALEKNMSQTN